MKIAILGTGSVGQALAKRLSGLGHQLFIGTRDVAETMSRTAPDHSGNPPIARLIGDNPLFELCSFREAVLQGDDLIVFAMNGQHALDCLKMVGEDLLSDKVMMDISNPLDFAQGFPPTLFACNTESLAERIQNAYPSLKVVKTLNTMGNPIMGHPELLRGDHTVFMSGNDGPGKTKVAELLKSFGWKDKNIMDLGDITTARGTEMILPLWVRIYGKLQTPMFNFSINTARAD